MNSHRTILLLLLLSAAQPLPFLAAQQPPSAPVVRDLPASASSVASQVTDAVSSVVSGDFSAAEHGALVDNFLSRTFYRITDCWTLCRQEIILAQECARKETVETAKAIFKKGADAAIEQSRDAILERLPMLNNSGSDSDSASKSND